jgi:hypothetical protein
LDAEMYEDEVVEGSYFKALINCFEVLLHLDQISLCDLIVKKLMTETKKQDFGYRYYKGKVHEKKR